MIGKYVGFILVCIAIQLQAQTDSVKEEKFVLDSALFLPVADTSALQSFASSKIDTPKYNTKLGKFWNNHKAKTAPILSALIPGLGQAYNRKYWKIPIVYAGFGGLGYATYYTATNYQQARHAYKLQVDLDSNTVGSYKGITDPKTLQTYRDYYKRNLDLAATFMAVWYLLNVVDAAVDGHLFHYDMNDKLSLDWNPNFQLKPVGTALQPSFGLGLTLNY